MAARRADALVDLITADDLGDGAVSRGRTLVTVVVDAQDGSAALEGGPEIPTTTAERLACDGRARVLLRGRSSNRLYLGRSRRLASPAQIAALTVRDGGRCQFPGCTHRRHLHAHHVIPWLRGGRTDLDNLLLVCGFHHGLVHDRGYRVTREGRGWRFLRPDGDLVPGAGAPLDGRVEKMIEISTRAGLSIGRNSLTPTWFGERLDPAPILDRLLPRASDARPPAARSSHPLRRRRDDRTYVSMTGNATVTGQG